MSERFSHSLLPLHRDDKRTLPATSQWKAEISGWIQENLRWPFPPCMEIAQWRLIMWSLCPSDLRLKSGRQTTAQSPSMLVHPLLPHWAHWTTMLSLTTSSARQVHQDGIKIRKLRQLSILAGCVKGLWVIFLQTQGQSRSLYLKCHFYMVSSQKITCELGAWASCKWMKCNDFIIKKSKY